VPLDKVYVDANLKETQLGPVAVGQTASVEVDALGGEALKGTVVSVAPASGSQFSLLPPENATGNFTKIVQRVPVRIAVAVSEAKGRLRPGLSVVVGIDTRTTPKKSEQKQAAK
jgi:membrane fusion protein (multidrug efflux system)